MTEDNKDAWKFLTAIFFAIVGNILIIYGGCKLLGVLIPKVRVWMIDNNLESLGNYGVFIFSGAMILTIVRATYLRK